MALELAAALNEAPLDYELHLQICQALGQTGAAMAPATLEALLALLKDPQTAASSGIYAAKALAHLGPHMPPQVRQAMLELLLETAAEISEERLSKSASRSARTGMTLPCLLRRRNSSRDGTTCMATRR